MAASSSSDPKPILFLDIDGVLNRTATAPQINLEQDKVDRLREVLAVSGAEVVLSTYWRAFEEYIAYTFGRMGAQGERVVGRTPGNPHLQDSVAHDDAVKTTRIVEITSYMESRFGSDRAVWPKFAIVDDKQVVPDGHEWSGRFVRTAHDVGLTDDAVTALVSRPRARIRDGGGGIRLIVVPHCASRRDARAVATRTRWEFPRVVARERID